MPIDPTSLGTAARRHVDLAQRVADAHRGLDDASLCSFVSGSTVDDLVDEFSDVDMSVVFARLPGEKALRAACRCAARTAGDGEWTWTAGNLDDRSDTAEGGVVAFKLDGTEVQIGYSTTAGLAANIDELLVEHNPDTPNHKLAEGISKALPLAGAEALQALQRRLADFPDGLARAMVEHGLNAKPTHWRAARQIVHRDAALWCRDIQVDACYALLWVLCGINRQWFTRFQFKRMRKLAAKLPDQPPRLVERMEAVLFSPGAREGFDALHALESEVHELVQRHFPDVDLEPARRRHRSYLAA